MNFIEYLRERYGRTSKQEVYSLLNGVTRDVELPTVLAERIKELTANVTVDDIRKEVLLKQMPTELRQHLNNCIDDLDFEAFDVYDVFDDVYDVFDVYGRLVFNYTNQLNSTIPFW